MMPSAIQAAKPRAMRAWASAARIRRAAATSGSRAARRPELPLEEEQAAGLLRGVGDQVGGHGPEAVGHVGGQFELGGDDGDEGLLPDVEEGQEHALLGAEVVVDGTRGAAGGLGHDVDRDGVDAVVGEELGGGREEALAGVGLAF